MHNNSRRDCLEVGALARSKEVSGFESQLGRYRPSCDVVGCGCSLTGVLANQVIHPIMFNKSIPALAGG